MTGSALLAGHAADLALGDPRRWHPVAGFGRVAHAVEGALYAPTRLRGTAYTLILVCGTAAVAVTAERVLGRRRSLALAALTWVALGGRSLTGEAQRVAGHLERGDLAGARAAIPSLVGRDPAELDAAGIARGAVESLAENTSDAVVCALLWGAVAGPAGIAVFRAANTLDAMVGNRSPRYREFGWASARLDDLLCWPGARLGALLTAVCAPLVGGSVSTTWATVRRDGGRHPSPNAGRMEAAFAGALGLRLGGTLAYGGRVEHRPELGDGRPPVTTDIRPAIRLSLAVGMTAALVCAALRSMLVRGFR
jgi:adenosylcobinamide-phosphate synthase